MGYYANTTEVDFKVPTDKVADALAAVNAALGRTGRWVKPGEPGYPVGSLDEGRVVAARWIEEPGVPTNYTSLTDALEHQTGFADCEQTEDGFVLGWHSEKYASTVDAVLHALAPFAVEGSFVRFLGEDDSLFGFRVVDGALRTESGEFTWTLDDLGS